MKLAAYLTSPWASANGHSTVAETVIARVPLSVDDDERHQKLPR
ncbi:hypothetical protein PENSTE_c012G09233 [Penicillium steckii]|uniref:Uncharacterized protein n=1 Tax=Penicillium steckii TaxID=303698 RepID=A0A1V6T5L8_9EURO|nr:hypothetical protein PENSTE_c012G09233 [Penicillium steckii]